jgi:hypothetical protein
MSVRAFRSLSINGHEDTGKGVIQLDQGNYEGSVRATILSQSNHTGRTVVIQKDQRVMPVDHLADRRLEKVKKCISAKTRL